MYTIKSQTKMYPLLQNILKSKYMLNTLSNDNVDVRASITPLWSDLFYNTF